MIDRESVKIPNLILTEEAKAQIKLMLQNDYTLAGKIFRIQISGKGCDGFSYSAGFTPSHQDDFKVLVDGIEILIDLFSAFYMQEILVDYAFDFENGTEGFVISNKNQDLYKDKFWKADKRKIPPLISNQ